MKKILFLLIAGSYSLTSIGQTKEKKIYTKDKDLSRWVIDVNFMGGGYSQKMNIVNTSPNYLNSINMHPGQVAFKNGGAIGGDIQVGYFMGKAKHWGIGTGLLYLREWGNATLNDFHAEYQSIDRNGYIFRQVVSSNSITERVKIDNFNIPLVLKYKNRFSKHWGFTADLGALFNLQMKSKYTTNAAFDYEAIYKFTTNENGVTTAIYETAAVPANADFLITKNQYIKNNPDGNVQDYFKTKYDAGYNVGLGVNPNQKKGVVSYTAGSVGFIIQPSLNYFLSDHVALNFGAYYIYQPFKNDGTGTYTMTGKPGEYNSVMNSSSKIQTQSYGANIGVRFLLGKKAPRLNITNTNQYDPSTCGSCDGSFTLGGFKAGENTTVKYNINEVRTDISYSGVADKAGTVTVPDLCAGSYSNIKATVGRKTADGKPVNLANPVLKITSVASENPTALGKCDGQISLFGFSSGQKATVTYTMNGEKKSFTNTVSSDNSIKLSNLCAGTVTNITVESNKCIAQLTNPEPIVLAYPIPVVNTPVVEIEDTMTMVLFDFDVSEIRPSSYGVVNRVYDRMKEDSDSYVVIDGNTDKIGTDEYNQKLSERRANAIRTYLVNKGIDGSRIRNQGNGEREPAASNSTAEGRSKNRRAEILVRIK
jgi:outer membrane protein OmpA-like peptidoglycan-associated protein